jgi:hypothetical protein
LWKTRFASNPMFMRSTSRQARRVLRAAAAAQAGSTDPASPATMRAMDEFSGAAKEPARSDDAPAVSPHLAPDPTPPPRPRRSVLPVALGAIAAAAIVIGLVRWGFAPRGATVTLESGGDKGQVLEPLQPRADVRTGEQVAPFSGFAVSVDTDPPGAVVSVGGVPRGESPVMAGLDCAPGDAVEITAEKGGFAVARARTTCRRDALVKLTVRLQR